MSDSGYVEVEADAARAVVEDLHHLRRRARGDRRATSEPLLTFGVLTMLGALVGTDLGPGHPYWAAAVPAGFGFLAWRQRRRAARTGVGEGSEPYGWFAIGFGLLLFVPFGLFVALLAPVVAISAGLLVVAARQRNRYLAVCAVAFGLLGTLEVPFGMLSNRLHDLADALGTNEARSGYFGWASELVVVVLALSLLGAGLLARRREAGAS